MALRVLLADESSTIKKVMQLALQDFAVEVKSVPVGLDVLSVAKTFKPDIVFADVLLSKRSGYDVCADLKNDPDTAHLPVVLMWSGFMELDESKAMDSRADRRLEKPFDADTLRHIVTELSQKTQSNPLSEYLTFPHMPDFDEPLAEITPADHSGNIYSLPEDSGAHYKVEPNDFDIPHDEDFAQVPLTTTPKKEEDGDWSHQNLSQFNISNNINNNYSEELSQPHIEVSGNFEEISFTEPPSNKTLQTAAPALEPKPQVAPAASAAPMKPNTPPPSVSVKAQSHVDIAPEMVEKILREQAREVIESICWKLLPDIAERVVREEIQKILRDSDKSV